jgi:GTPase
MFDSLFIPEENKFYPEDHDGNIEYKWRLDTKNDLGVKKLTTQMMWRLNEGYENTGIREAHYLLGVYDNGSLGKLTEEELQYSINIFKDSIKPYNIEIQKEFIKFINDSYVYYALIIQNNILDVIKEKNVIIIGDQQSGKTSLISNICYDANVRSQILKHVHEKINGITTDIKKEIIGIKNDKIINYVNYCGWDEIAKNSEYIINIYDIPVINMKTIINYILGIMPEHMIIISKTYICIFFPPHFYMIRKLFIHKCENSQFECSLHVGNEINLLRDDTSIPSPFGNQMNHNFVLLLTKQVRKLQNKRN